MRWAELQALAMVVGVCAYWFLSEAWGVVGETMTPQVSVEGDT